MNNLEVKQVVGDIPFMDLERANRLTSFMSEYALRNVLELGFAHGVSTCYMAAALDRFGSGHIVTIDREVARQREPNIEELLTRIGQRQRVTIYFEPTSYTWRLMKFLDEDPHPEFDMCYLDGAHSWFVDALAFFLVDLLLKPGGWIIFDDFDWTYASSPTLSQKEEVLRMPEDERVTPHVRKIYELLIRPHHHYHNFRVEYGWAFAQKKSTASVSREREVVVEKIIEVQEKYLGIGWFLMCCAKKLIGK